MDQELQDSLVSRHPNLYRDINGDAKKTLMCFGICTGNGWYDLIDDLSNKLEQIIVKIPEPERRNYCAFQIKEKYSGLRCYMNKSNPEIQKLIDEAEERSLETCEMCGKDGKPRRGSWISTLCDRCANGRELLI